MRKLPVKKNMKEQEKGEGSDGKENMKTRSDESGEEKNGDDDNQKSAQKKKGENRLFGGLKHEWVSVLQDDKRKRKEVNPYENQISKKCERNKLSIKIMSSLKSNQCSLEK